MTCQICRVALHEKQLVIERILADIGKPAMAFMLVELNVVLSAT